MAEQTNDRQKSTQQGDQQRRDHAREPGSASKPDGDDPTEHRSPTGQRVDSEGNALEEIGKQSTE